MKNIIITEEQFKYLMQEMSYPTTFNMDEFKSLTSFQKRIEYCKQRLRRLGAGTSRIVYEIDDEKVLKLAKNNKGIAQNQEEIKLGTDYYTKSLGCFTEVYDYDDNSLFVEMEKAIPAKESDFERLTGYPFEMYCDFITRCAKNYSPNSKTKYYFINHAYDDAYQQCINDEYSFIYNVMDYMSNYQLTSWGDLTRISSYGIVKRDGEDALVIIDFGLSGDVWNNFYKK